MVSLLYLKHRGKFKSLTVEEKKSLKRRQAIEPIIGHLKADHRMNRCHLKGSNGDSLHAVLCAAGQWFAATCSAIAANLCLRTTQVWFHEMGRGLKVNFSGATKKGTLPFYALFRVRLLCCIAFVARQNL
jgi:hypothetical protein